MRATYITRENAEYFAEAIPKDILEYSNLFIGCTDEDDTAIGVLCADTRDPEDIIILYIYVASHHRRKGAAMEMMSLLDYYALLKGYDSAIVNYYATEDSGLMSFFEAMGYELDDEDLIRCYNIRMKDMNPEAFKNNLSVGSDKGKLISLKECTAAMWNELIARLNKVQNQEERVFVHSRVLYEADLSTIVMVGGKVCGCVLMERIAEDRYRVAYVNIIDSKYPLLLIPALKRSFLAAREKLRSGDVLTMGALNDKSEKLIKTIVGKKAKVHTQVRQFKIY